MRLAKWYGGAASVAPLVVVLDDLQWADATSVRVLAFVGAAVRDTACLLLATYRSDELERELMAALARVGTTLTVPRLSDEAAAELLRAAVGHELSAATDAIVQRSAGNPLFVWEFGQLTAQSGRFDVAPAAIPDAVAAVIERRMARLSETAVAVVRTAAVIGNRFSVDTVSQVGQVAVDDASAGLGTAASAGLVIRGEVSTDFMFSHDLVREVALGSLDMAQRSQLHARAAAGRDAAVRHGRRQRASSGRGGFRGNRRRRPGGVGELRRV
jgi:predicted ATPase